MKSLRLLLPVLIFVLILSACEEQGSQPSTQQTPSSMNAPCNSGAVFIIRCAGEKTIRIDAIQAFGSNIVSPPKYQNQFSLVDVFKDNIGGPSIANPNGNNGNISTSGTIISGTVNFPASATLTQSNGGSFDSYDILFRSASPISPGQPISGFVELQLAGTNLPFGWDVLDVIKNSGSGPIPQGVVLWGLPGTPSSTCLGDWYFFEDSSCN